MVRVNHPPGGASKIHDEARREPKTVRVLKPPGGESSISFGEDSDRRKQDSGNGVASSPSPQDSPSPAGAEAAPTFEAAVASPEATSTPEGNDAAPTEDCKESSHTKDARSSPSDSSNGTTPSESTTESAAETPSPTPDPPKQTPSDVGVSSDSNGAEVVYNGAENGASSSAVPSPSPDVNGRDVAAEIESSVDRVESSIAEESHATTSVSSESHHQTSTEIRTVEEHSSSASELVAHTTQQNGSAPAKVKAPSPEPPSRSATPSTPRASEDTTDRMFGRPTTATPQSAPPRKIVDHMRSNIFMSDEDYTPTRSSRMNAAVVTDTSPAVPAAGQRQRIPPGGFSTKLW